MDGGIILLFENIDKEFNKSYGEYVNEKYPCIKAYIVSYIESEKQDYDTDVSEKAMKFYKEKWSFLRNGQIQNKLDRYNKNNYKKQIFLSKNEYVVYGDTLNSFKHIFTFFS